MKKTNENNQDRSVHQTERSQEQGKNDQQKSDPPLTEIKGVTDPEEYVEPPVEDESKDKKK